MLITVERFTGDDDTTLSRVLVDGAFCCFGLEDEYRDQKLAGETRIPAGTYPVRVRQVGGFHWRYARRFQRTHRGMLHVCEVPEFEYILVHCGNTDDDTAGCLLVGAGAMAEPGGMSLMSSVRAYLRFYALVIDAAMAGALVIEYLDNDRQRLPLLA
ncbi:MAG: DUF5675 family protein [Gammaproteobacteria bacterium]